MMLYTFGYQLYEPADLWEACDRNDVDAVIDVRRSAVSKKPGWGLSDLSSDERYEHRPDLGNVRGAENTWEPVSVPEAEAALENLSQRMQRGETLLLLCAEPRCFEITDQGHRVIHCHRYVIAQRLQALTDCRVRHLL